MDLVHHRRGIRVSTADQHARRFFWSWLIGSAAVSTAGVTVHALLGSARSPVIASAVAMVIVLIQLCATWSVHVLVQAQIAGTAYRCALAIAIVLALGAFAINFAALYDLANTWADIAWYLAWIVPLIVDLGMTASTVSLLALTSAQHTTQPNTAENHSAAEVHADTHTAAHPVEREAHDDEHLVVARRIVGQGTVRIAPERVAQVLEAHAAGTAPSTIQRTLKVGYSTVQRILDYQQTA